MIHYLFNENKDNKTRNLLTLSTCWYVLKSKFNIDTYLEWITNLLSITYHFNLVIYTDEHSIPMLIPLINNRTHTIKIIIKPMKEFYTYKYKNNWIINHSESKLDLHQRIDWKLNMLWNEKIFFVQDTIEHKYFDTMYYGWCDIGYFRNRPNDLHTKYLQQWPNPRKLLGEPFTSSFIHYGCVQNNTRLLNYLKNDIQNHYNNNLSSQPTNKLSEISFAGGFFISKPELIVSYATIYNEKLMYYFTNRYIIKDDQTIVTDIIFTNPGMFYIHNEYDKRFDNWFMFQRLLV